MLAARTHRAGASDELRVETLPVPRPGPGQVLLRVESVSVNFSDVKRRRGDTYPFPTPMPFVPGGEVAGTVAACGEGVEGFETGASVFGLVGGDGSGGYAQYALAQAGQVQSMPPGLDFDRASVLTIAGGTAMLLLGHAARLQAGESVLIPAATGGVGSYAIQIARQRGAGQVIAATSPGKLDEAASLGADGVVDDTQAGWADEVRRATGGRGVDVLLEASGGRVLAEGLTALAPFGRAVVYGAASAQRAELDAATLDRLFYDPAPNQSLSAFNLGGWFMGRPAVAGAALGELIGLVLGGAIRTPRLQALPLAQAAHAHALLEARQGSGKIVLKPWL